MKIVIPIMLSVSLPTANILHALFRREHRGDSRCKWEVALERSYFQFFAIWITYFGMVI